MSCAAFELANTSICVGLPDAAREYEARATSTPPVVDFLPVSVNWFVSMQSAAGPVYGFTPVVLHGLGLFAPPMPGPSILTKFVPAVLPVTACAVTPSPM